MPNVVGQTIDQARGTLEGAGWQVAVGEAVNSDQPTNIIVQQNPSGQAPAGSVITINPSNGQAATVPDVSGQNPAVAAGALNAAGFSAQARVVHTRSRIRWRSCHRNRSGGRYGDDARSNRDDQLRRCRLPRPGWAR